MSRHVIRDDGDYEVVVGWDPQLHSFFGVVHDKAATAKVLESDKDADEVLAAWVGLSPYAISDLQRLQREIIDYVTISVDDFALLAADKALNR